MTATSFRANEVIILLGAGASVEADIPDSSKMVENIEKLVSNNEKWKEFKSLYHYIRSSIYYADGLRGKFGNDVLFNIERLVNVLDELQKKERHTLYPFVGAWNPTLQNVAGAQFEKIEMFQDKIMDILRRQWIALSEKEHADYYKGLLRFQNEYQFPLRVFSLNYDLCVEQVCGSDKVQRGFTIGERVWDWRAFDETSDDRVPILLYKLHGSADWQFTKEHKVRYNDSPLSIEDKDIAIIFGTDYKFQYIDPFLFLAYELRRWTLDDARVIVCIGYGFNDEHINGILQQSLRQKQERRLLAIVGPRDTSDTAISRISNQLNVQNDQVVVVACGAKEFLNNILSKEFVLNIVPLEEPNLIPEKVNLT